MPRPRKTGIPVPVPQIARSPDPSELEALRDMGRHLAQRAQRCGGKTPAWLDDAEDLDEKIFKQLGSAVKRLVGEDQLAIQRRCCLSTPHARGVICEDCGYSDNLYLQALEKILRRRGKTRRTRAAS